MTKDDIVEVIIQFQEPVDQPVLWPTDWQDRVKKPSKAYCYSKAEIMEYNEMLYLHGAELTKAWADRRFNERT